MLKGSELDQRVRPFLIRDESTPAWLQMGKEIVRGVVPQEYWALIRNRVFRGERVEYPYRDEVGGVRYIVSTAAERYRLKHLVGEKGYLEEIAGSLRPGDVYLDVGAAIGTHSLPIKKQFGDQITVIGIEPDPEAYRRYVENSRLNNLDILACNIALGAIDGKMMLGTAGLEGLCPSFRSSWRGSKVEVDVRSLDGLVDQKILPSPDVVKIDVEGAEGEILRGMLGLLMSPNSVRELFLEIHEAYLPDFGISADRIWEVVIRFGFSPVSVRKRGSEYLCHLSR